MKNLRNIRNQFDFFLRSHITVGKSVPPNAPIPKLDANFQKESVEFFDMFSWKSHLARFEEEDSIRVVDIGARNFALAPVIENLFETYGFDSEIHGIELDAYRRLVNFRTRKNYGDFYASKIRNGEYRVMDFLDWQTPFHFAFLLNPFVTELPVLAWGLPLSKLKPEDIFSHLYGLLKPENGLALISSPSEDEFEIVKRLSLETGFRIREEQTWFAHGKSVQKQSRHGIVVSV